MHTIEIKVGESWKWDTEYLQLLSHEGRCDLYAIQDVLEILVDGVSLTSHRAEDSIFYLLRDLALGLLRLSDEESAKCLVPFYENPYELVVQRMGSTAWLSFYRISGAADVVIRNQAVSFRALLDQVASNIETLSQALVSINPALAHDAFLQSLVDAVPHLRRHQKQLPMQTTPPRTRQHKRQYGRTWRAPKQGPFAISFCVDANDSALLHYTPEHTLDLHSLLVTGKLSVRGAGLSFQSQEGHPFLFFEELLQGCLSIVFACENGETRPHAVVNLQPDKLFLHLEKEILYLTLSTASQSASIASLPLADFVSAVVSATRSFCQTILALSPKQQHNECLQDLRTDTEDLWALFSEMTLDDIENPNPALYQQEAKSLVETASSSRPSQLRRLSFAAQCGLRIDDGRFLTSTEKTLVVGFAKKLLGFERDRGQILWEVGGWNAATDTNGGILLAAWHEQSIRRIDPSTGKVLWESRIGGSNVSPEGPLLLFSRQGRKRILFATADRRAICLDFVTGRRVFSAELSRRGQMKASFEGRLLYLCCEDGTLQALDSANGALVFRRKLRSRLPFAPLICGDQIVISANANGEARLIAFDAFRGTLLWERGVGKQIEPEPVYVEGAVVACTQSDESLRLLCLDAGTGDVRWIHDLGKSNHAARPVVAESRIFVVDDLGNLSHCYIDGNDLKRLHLGTGEVLFSPIQPTYQGGLLFVCTDTLSVVHPQSGQVIGRVQDCPAPPEKLRIEDNFDLVLAVDDDFVATYQLTSQLSVVQ